MPLPLSPRVPRERIQTGATMWRPLGSGRLTAAAWRGAARWRSGAGLDTPVLQPPHTVLRSKHIRPTPVAATTPASPSPAVASAALRSATRHHRRVRLARKALSTAKILHPLSSSASGLVPDCRGGPAGLLLAGATLVFAARQAPGRAQPASSSTGSTTHPVAQTRVDTAKVD